MRAIRPKGVKQQRVVRTAAGRHALACVVITLCASGSVSSSGDIRASNIQDKINKYIYVSII